VGKNLRQEKHVGYRDADKSLARPGKKQATATTNFCKKKKKKKKNQKFVCPTRSPRQQCPPRWTKNGDLPIAFSVGLG
jgi:hypothetical protein